KRWWDCGRWGDVCWRRKWKTELGDGRPETGDRSRVQFGGYRSDMGSGERTGRRNWKTEDRRRKTEAGFPIRMLETIHREWRANWKTQDRSQEAECNSSLKAV